MLVAIRGVADAHFTEGFFRDQTIQSLKEATILDMIDSVLELAKELLIAFAGKTITVADIYFNHGLERPHTPAQYKEVLKLLESENKVVTKPPADQRRENTLADHVEIQFPPKGA